MSSFTDPLEIRPAPPHRWATTRKVGFWIGALYSGLYIEAPAGFLTDLGSIPVWIRWLLPRDDPRWAAAFVLHDWLCEQHEFPRYTAAAIFLEMLLVLVRANDVPWHERWRVNLMASGVTVWAWVRPYPRPA